MADRLAGPPAEHAEIVERFARWAVLRRLRLHSAEGTLTYAQVVNGRWQIRAATRFLAWTARQGTTISLLQQADLDRYLASNRAGHQQTHPIAE